MCDQLVTDCSGNGHIDNSTGGCVCNSGYSSFADFRFFSGRDCDVQPRVVLGLWVTLSVLFVPALALSIRNTWRKGRKHGVRAIVDVRKLDTRLNLSLLVESALFFFMSIVKATSVESRLIGNDALVTYLYLFCSAFLPLCGTFLMDIMLALTTRQLRFHELRSKVRVITYVRIYEWILTVILIATAFAVWYSLYAPQSGCVLLQVSLNLNGFVFFAGLIVPPAAINLLIQDIRSIVSQIADKPVNEQHALQRLLKRLEGVRGQLIGMNILNSAWFVITANTPFLLRKVFYSYPVMLISGIPMLLFLGALTISGFTKESTSTTSVQAEAPQHEAQNAQVADTSKRQGLLAVSRMT